MPPRPITTGLAALAVSESLVEGQETERRGFDVEAEATTESIASIAALYRGAGYFLECITAVDQEDYRELWYQFNRLENKTDRHLIRLPLEADSAPSIAKIFGAANWFEREAFDMMGIQIDDHPYLVRLLLPEDADFHPLRRDQCIDEELRAKREKARAKRLKAEQAALAKAQAAATAQNEAAKDTPESTASKAEAPKTEPPKSEAATTATPKAEDAKPETPKAEAQEAKVPKLESHQPEDSEPVPPKEATEKKSAASETSDDPEEQA